MNTLILQRTNSSNPQFRTLVNELDQHLRIRNGEIMDIYDQHNVIENIDTVVIACLENVPVACGCFKPFDEESVEIKRMFVKEEARGKGISLTVLTELENWARELCLNYTVLETGVKQIEALGLYPKAGYVDIPRYGPYVDLPDSICFRKSLK
jgi:putative acetyltransferase